MSLLDSLRMAAITALGFKTLPQMSNTGSRHTAPDRRGFEQQAKAYLNQIVLACVATRAQTLNEAPLTAVHVETGANIPTHPITRLFRRPNPYMSQAMFWQYVSTYIDIGGNAYIHKVRNVYGQVIELWPYHDGHIKPVSDSGQWVDYYRYQFDGRTVDIDPRDIIHMRSYYIDPLNPVMGISPIRAAGLNVDTYNELMQTLYSYLKNNGVPSGVLQVQNSISSLQAEGLKDQFQANTTGKNRGKPIVLPMGMSYTQMGLDVSSLEAGGQFRQYETAICSIYRVHPSVVMTTAGLESSTYSNMKTAHQEYTQLTRVPTWNTWEEQVELSFSNEYPEVNVEFDTSNVAALKADTEVINSIVGQYASNLITLNEARTNLGYAPIDTGDKFSYEATAPAPGFLSANAKVEGADATVIVDIDGTVLNDNNEGIQKNVDYVNELHKTHRIEIVSGRPDTTLVSTKNQLANAGLHYDGIHLNDTTAPSIDWKRYKAGKLLETQNVTLAIDNDRDVRDMYESLGIKAISPGDIVTGSKGLYRPGLPTRGVLDQSKDTKAEAFWRGMDTVIRDSAEELKPATSELMLEVGKVISSKLVAGKSVKSSPELTLLVEKYMKTTATWRARLMKQIIPLALSEVGGDLSSVQGLIDDLTSQVARDMNAGIKASIDNVEVEVNEKLGQWAADELPEGVPDRTTYISGKLTETFDNLSTGRANNIARTTSRALSSTIATNTWDTLNEENTDTEEEIVKVWTTRRDGAVRDSHRKLDGVWVTMGSDFATGITAPGIGEKPGEVVNCRCVLRPVKRKNLGRQAGPEGNR